MPSTFQLSGLKFAAGATSDAEGLEVEPNGVMIVVGPNNSGKSQLLREIEYWCRGEGREMKVLESLSVDYPTDVASLDSYMRRFETPPLPSESVQPGNIVLQPPSSGDEISRQQINLTSIRSALDQRLMVAHPQVRDSAEQTIRSQVLRFYVARLDGVTRFSLISAKPTGDLTGPPRNHLQALAKDPEALERLRTLIFKAFGRYPALDPVSQGGYFRIRLHARAPTEPEELSLGPAAIRYHAAGTLIDEAGDGVKCYCGLLAAALGLPHRIILIDEPEAFLPPPIAHQLGSNLAALGSQTEMLLVASTHSADFLLGCIEATQNTTIVRLTYDQNTNTATARSLSPGDVKELVGSPYARSANVLSALFHRGAIVTEADADRVFYEEINRRLRAAERGAADTLFLNVNGRQIIQRVVGPLRRIGVPAVAIPDLDILENGSELQSLMRACGISEAQRGAFVTEAGIIVALFGGLPPAPNGGRAIQEQGINALAANERLRAKHFLDDLGRYGLFPVHGGQLESWFSELGIQERKLTWLPAVFAQIGQNPADSNYRVAGTGGVWEFLDRIAMWIDDPLRRGTD